MWPEIQLKFLANFQSEQERSQDCSRDFHLRSRPTASNKSRKSVSKSICIQMQIAQNKIELQPNSARNAFFSCSVRKCFKHCLGAGNHFRPKTPAASLLQKVSSFNQRPNHLTMQPKLLTLPLQPLHSLGLPGMYEGVHHLQVKEKIEEQTSSMAVRILATLSPASPKNQNRESQVDKASRGPDAFSDPFSKLKLKKNFSFIKPPKFALMVVLLVCKVQLMLHFL